MLKKDKFLGSGRLAIGANYWASHAGLMMWRNWREDIVAEDFKALEQEGLQVLRIFRYGRIFSP